MRFPVRRTLIQALNKIQTNLDPQENHITVQRLLKLGRSCREYLNKNPKRSEVKILWPTLFNIDKLWWAHDGLLANALMVRGAEIIPTSCGKLQISECMIHGGVWQDDLNKELKINREDFCRSCIQNDYTMWSTLDIKPINLSSFVTHREIEDIKCQVNEIMQGNWEECILDSFPVGKSALNAVVNNEMQDRIKNSWQEQGIQKSKAHIFNILALKTSYERVFEIFKPNRIFGNGGFYYQWGIVDHIARKLNISYYRYYWEGCHAPLSWNYNKDTHKIIDFDLAWPSWSKVAWDDKKELRVKNDLRKRGFLLDINEDPKYPKKKEAILAELRLVSSRPIILVLGGVIYDANTNAPGSCYQDMYEWMIDTIAWANRNPDVQIVIRTHPAEEYVAEIGKKARTRFADEIKILNICIPPNVRIIEPLSKISSYDLMHIADIGVSYASTTGLEFACLGKPCFPMGPAHYANKGFTIDPKSKDEYYSLLKNFAISKNKINNSGILAKKYWYFYAFHAAYVTGLLETDSVQKLFITKIDTTLKDITVEDILPGKNPQLDYVCDAILGNKPLYGENIWPPEMSEKLEF